MRDFLYTDLPFADSGEIIFSFFDGNSQLIDTFNRVCLDMLNFDGELVFRYNQDIIGMAKGNEQYRFYLTCRDNVFFIKYKHRNKIRFSSSDIGIYLTRNKDNYELFLKNGERLTHAYTIERRENRVKNRTVDISAEWGELRARYKEHSTKGKECLFDLKISRAYGEIIKLLTDAADELLSPTDASILKRRIFTNAPQTLRDIAKELELSAERVRQRQNNATRRLTEGIYKNNNEKFVKYRE